MTFPVRYNIRYWLLKDTVIHIGKTLEDFLLWTTNNIIDFPNLNVAMLAKMRLPRITFCNQLNAVRLRNNWAVKPITLRVFSPELDKLFLLRQTSQF